MNQSEPPSQPGVAPAWFPVVGFSRQAMVVCLVGFVLYLNSCFNEYAFDDGLVIVNNDYVQQGFKGIGRILSSDAYESFYQRMQVKDQLSGGRYRPLSLVTFAIEHQLFGENWTLRHGFNVALFLCSLVAILFFLRTVVFPTRPEVALLATLLFAIHPIHTEVVANVKSRDEILSLLFMVLTLLYSFQYSQNQGAKKKLWLALGCYVLALLSKEYAVTLVVLIPLTLQLFSRPGLSARGILQNTIPFLVVVIAYLGLRWSIVVMKTGVVDDDVLNHPYLFAHGSEAIATKISTLLNYVKLLCFPHPLAADYSYNQIPYKQLTHWSVWVSLLVHGSMVYLAWKWMQERHPLAFAMAFYLLPLSLVSNLFFEIGATMGERLIYHSSLGFCVIVAFYAWTALATVKWPEQTKKETVLVAAVALVALGGYPVIQRNADWESDLTLFTKDVQTVPESALVNSHAGGRWVDLSDLPENRARRAEYLDKAIGYLNKSLILHPKCVSSYLNLGVAYYKLNDLEKARQNWDLARHYSPGHPDLKRFYPLIIAGYANQGLTLDAENAPPEATLESKAATERDPKMANAWYSLGGAYFAMEDMAHAKAAWEKALRSNPDHARARQGLDLFEAKSK